MTQELWLNLPVKNIAQSVAFFTALGFEFNTKFGGDASQMACMLVGRKKVVIMLCAEPLFKNLVQHDLANTQTASQLLISIDAESRAEVNELAVKVVSAGGTIFAQPHENQGWMYGMGFADLDGHRWNVLYMDSPKMQGK